MAAEGRSKFSSWQAKALLPSFQLGCQTHGASEMRDEEVGSAGIFDLSPNAGVNDSEKSLSTLCKGSFLELWYYANTYRKINKELIDGLVVFGDDLILFSDKHCEFNQNIDLEIAWPRWCRKAIDRSASQLGRAADWVKKYPNQLFLDKDAKILLPTKIPLRSKARLHLIATVRGIDEACSKLGGRKFGMELDTGLSRWCPQEPFRIGRTKSKHDFIHVFDSASIELILKELDTISDFIVYLEKREILLNKNEINVQSYDERCLLTNYLYHRQPGYRGFMPRDSNFSDFDGAIYTDGLVNAYFCGERRKKKISANEISYLWDGLINKFTNIGAPLSVPGFLNESVQLEHMLRCMASEDRLSRRSLATGLMDVISRAENDIQPRMNVRTMQAFDSDLVYVFCAYPRESGASLDESRKIRATVMRAYCAHLLAQKRNLRRVICYSFDHPRSAHKTWSDDLTMIVAEELSDAEAEMFCDPWGKLGLSMSEITAEHIRVQEFPD